MDKEQILNKFIQLLPETLNEGDKKNILYWVTERNRELSLLQTVYESAVQAGYEEGYKKGMKAGVDHCGRLVFEVTKCGP